jgi:hypothetical protein
MTISSITTTSFEIEFVSCNMVFKESLSSSCFLAHEQEDDLSSTESTFYGEDCTSIAFDDDYFDDDGSASTCSSSSNSNSSRTSTSTSSSSSSSCSSSETSISMAPTSRGAVVPRLGDEDSIVLARRRSQQQRTSTEQHEQDQEEITVALLEGLTIEIPLRPLEGEYDLFYPAAAAA